ncbi:carboxymuconolactone decarboxylase family protein [mine drainage metagenome]|uniref:Carboxymuconolactone decarboxylase family protein n=1 Tax=mine drainage metagenome TaxID=410659 RepID=A0A1J5S1E0_9ZZZZ
MVNFTFHTPENTSGPTKELLTGIQKGYGFFPNLYGYMAEAPTTVEAYLALNDLVSKTSLTPGQQQVALLAVSVENGCDFCTVAHRAMGKMKKANEQTLTAVSSHSTINNPHDRALAAFAQSVTKNRGRPSESEVQAFLDAGFNKQQILEVILIVSIKTLSNYINHLTHPEPNKELLGMV